MKWKRGMAILCLVAGLILQAGPDGFCAGSAEQGKEAAAGQDELSEDGKQGASDGGGTGFAIDSQNVYEGMEKSWSQGYVPKIEKRKAVVVLPLQAKRKLSGNQITASLSLGESEHLPFVQKNYEKIVSYGYHKTKKGGALSGCWLVVFHLELEEERYNGDYPVTVSVHAQDEEGGEIYQEFTVHVTITDGVGKQELSDGSGGFAIDNQRIYKGMEKPYSRGYVPVIRGDRAVIVLPLQAKRKLSGNRMAVSLSFGESEHSPFVQKNYEKEVKFKNHKTGKNGKRTGGYLVTFPVKLKKKRYNGNYPVTLSVCAEDKDGNELRQDFTVYVVIKDEKKAGADDGGGEGKQAQFAPRVMIESCRFSEKKILCGQKFTAKLTLRNTSKTDPVKNMLVTVVPDENIELCGETGSAYVEELGSGGSCELSFVFRVKAAAPCGQYSVGITMDYADGRGTSYTLEDAVKVSAEQQTKIEIAPHCVPKEIQMGETVDLQTQVMNLGKGKLYNVRAMLEADGLSPSGLAFIGDIEAGTSMTGSMEFTAEGLSGEFLYGTTQGKITFYYEDEAGKEMTQEQRFETSIVSPLKEEKTNRQTDDTGQWWVIMTVIAVLLILAAVIVVVRRLRQDKTGEAEENEK